MMKVSLKISALFLFGFLLWACDKIETPIDLEGKSALEDVVIAENISMTYDQLETYSWDTVVSPSNRNKQFILLEEFTGHTCPNCPLGTKELLRLDSIYKEQLIPISIHAGGFAVPQNNPDGSFATDHRVPEILEEKFIQKMSIQAFPTGLVQRSGNVELYISWEQTINGIKDDAPKAAVQIRNLYNSNLGIIRTTVDYEWLESLNDEYLLQVFLKEDHIVDWQINIDYNEPNYDHRHVLQKVVNKLFGVPVEEAVLGNTGRKEYIFKADPAWDIQNTAVVAFLYKSDAPYNVVQVNEAAVVE